MVYSLNAVGSVEAFEKVQVTARVAGVVEKVQFAEGSRVGAGQVLVEIEPQRYTPGRGIGPGCPHQGHRRQERRRGRA